MAGNRAKLANKSETTGSYTISVGKSAISGRFVGSAERSEVHGRIIPTSGENVRSKDPKVGQKR